MPWYIGVDGGGTKTAFVIGRDDGKPLCQLQYTGCSYQEIGVEAVIKLLSDGVSALLAEARVSVADVAGCCIGLPCYGESEKMDDIIQQALSDVLAPIPVHIVNDGVVGWAGSLACQEGIHLVSGTGSIAFGCGCDGTIRRSGGWCEFFGDEGSCYWIGREAMSLFSKEADGRAPRGALYEQVCKAYGVEEPFELIEIIIRDIAPHRERVAAFQLHAEKAAIAGDEAAIDLYRKAADELVQMVYALHRQLSWSSKEVKVSYFGGLFRAGELILGPLRERLSAMGCVLQPPLRSAVEGALLLSINTYK